MTWAAERIPRGKFLTVEGIDGSGKTTNIQVLVKAFEQLGHKVFVSREPGGTDVGDEVRRILLDGFEMHDVTELLLFLASRNENVQKNILPHLEDGWIVICDRFHDSTFAYQGHGRGMLKDLEKLGEYVNGHIKPDYTLFFDIPYEESIRRLGLRVNKQDRLDLESDKFRRLVYNGYQERLGALHRNGEPHFQFNRNIHRIDALPAPEQVAQQVIAWVNTNFPPVIKNDYV